MGRKVAFYTLGCKFNQYETQLLSERFSRLGFETVGETEWADVYVINSCTVTGMADRKSRNFARRSKRLNPQALTAMVGCYAEVAADALREMPEIDLLLGAAEKDSLPERVQTLLSPNVVVLDPLPHSQQTTPPGTVTGLRERTRAYLKIEDGCDRFCAYCIVPYARGAVRSRPEEDILREARALLENGYKEIILAGINLALYGTDTGALTPGSGILRIIDRISELPGDFRIRLSSLEPTVIDEPCAQQLTQRERLCPHLHLSLQSGSDDILARMGRRYRMDGYRRIAEVLKAHDPDWSITTDLIVGFPGETEADFAASLCAVQEIGFSRLHVFRYSRREGTRAASMPDQIPGDVKNERSRRLIEAGEQSAARFLEQNRGKTRQALVLGRVGVEPDAGAAKHVYEGITDNDIEVRIRSASDLTNCFVPHVIG
jgi:threonylcarbamoyladenosine tRNA methylthiotransferase MtaB